MERIDPRICEAIRNIAEVTGMTECQAGEIVLKSLRGYDLTSQYTPVPAEYVQAATRKTA